MHMDKLLQTHMNALNSSMICSGIVVVDVLIAVDMYTLIQERVQVSTQLMQSEQNQSVSEALLI